MYIFIKGKLLQRVRTADSISSLILAPFCGGMLPALMNSNAEDRMNFLASECERKIMVTKANDEFHMLDFSFKIKFQFKSFRL